MVPSTGETQLRGLVALALCLAVGYLAIGTTFQWRLEVCTSSLPVLHGSVFHWPGCSSRISHTACHLAFWRIHFGRFFFWILQFLAGLFFFCMLNLDPKSIKDDRILSNFPKLRSTRPWNKFLASDPGRNRPILHNLMALAVGGKHRWNEMLYDTQPQHQITPKILRGLSYICRSRVF